MYLKTQESIESAFASLEQHMKVHDWYYDYSDDHRVWTRGHNERSQINRLSMDLREKDKARVEALYDTYSPFRKEQKAREATG